MAETWRAIVASSLDWEQAHVSLDNALKDLPANLRGERPAGSPYSIWELLEHLRLAQHDLLEFCVNPEYQETLEWPKGYWPATPAPPNEKAWKHSLAEIHRDRDAFKKFTMDEDRDLTEKIPRGTGQTYLRTILVAMDHAAYHVGQIVVVRRLLGNWKA